MAPMILLGLVGDSLSRSEAAALWIGSLALLSGGAFALVRWMRRSPVTPDPWDEQVAMELADVNCTPVCHGCLTPQDPSLHHCPHCGAMIGDYTSVMPPLYLYAIGQVFRAGLDGRYRRSFFLNFGYFFAAFAAYGLIAPLFLLVPVYWIMFLLRLIDSRDQVDGAAPPAPSA